MTTKTEIKELIVELSIHFDKLREKAAYLALKEAELWPDDYISQSLYTQAVEELRFEQSLLAGHALMVQQDIQKKRLALSFDDRTLLREIVAYSRRLPFL